MSISSLIKLKINMPLGTALRLTRPRRHHVVMAVAALCPTTVQPQIPNAYGTTLATWKFAR